MAQQEEGWPMGLQPVLNARIELARNGNNSGSISFNTLVTASPTSSTDSSSDLDTESTGSFFPDNSTTLGSLMGVSSIEELSRRSLRGSKTEINKDKNKFNFMSWLFCLSSRNRKNHEDENQKSNAPSLGQYLAVERRENRRIQNHLVYGPDDEVALAEANIVGESNSLFVNGNIAPPKSMIISPRQRIGKERKSNMEFGNSLRKLFSCTHGSSALG